jgi:uncharacterized membrane protein YidH (DUF202 family)
MILPALRHGTSTPGDVLPLLLQGLDAIASVRQDPRVADEQADVDRRTSLAGERTLLAWWRTGFTAIAVALGVGRVVPALAPNATRWPYAVLGIGFAFYGIAMIGYGTRRIMELDSEIGVAPVDRRAARTMWALAIVGMVLGVFTAVRILVE